MDVKIGSSTDSIDGYVAVPPASVAGEGPWPGVVIVHDIAGLGDDSRSIAERFATAGYLAVVPDLFGHGGFVRCVRAVMGSLRSGQGQAFQDIDAARALLAARPDCTGKIGVVGFCMGGGFALLTAAGHGFDVSAPYYGDVPRDEAALDDACPIVASYGAKDRRLAGSAAKLEKRLTERGIPHDVKEYPDAAHSFANRLSLGPFGPILRVAGMGYHHESSEDAWRRVFAFFAEHLR
ncbi:MAG TPA: dienelactone hydrolase family protein [Pseudonocardiaceae bacterium]|nr:dienelactone hydrolase family protein [Pseudonocardiaceae bacterium]